MAFIHINIGSNVDKLTNINQAIYALAQVFDNVEQSSIYQSPAEGFVGNDFYNLGVNAQTILSVDEVLNVIHKIEDEMGRDRAQPKFSNRVIDLDLVLYDQLVSPIHKLPRADILKYAFVLAPLAELMPKVCHPVVAKNYQQLWRDFDLQKKHQLKRL